MAEFELHRIESARKSKRSVGTKWRDCIVTMYDLSGIKKRASDSGAGSNLMRQLHRLIVDALHVAFPTVERAYCWNDSVLLLSYLQDQGSPVEAVMRDADLLKRCIDRLTRSYAVAVKGQAFPQPPKRAQSPRVTVIEASSYAMANCFLIEKRVGKLHKAWYVDGRIAEQIRTNQRSSRRTVTLLPSRKPRSIYVYDGYLWSAEPEHGLGSVRDR